MHSHVSLIRKISAKNESGWLGLRPGWLAQRGGQTDVGMDGQTDVGKISPSYRTSFPIGAAAQKERYKPSFFKGTHLFRLNLRKRWG